LSLEPDIILNYYLSQKFKLIGINKFNHLINTITNINFTSNARRINFFFALLN
jgi:hypothetical protein